MTLSVRLDHRFGDFHLRPAFEIAEPGITVLFGPSGCGKTSTIQAIAGLLRPEAGRIAINGTVLLDTGGKVNMRPRKRRIGYVFQEARLFPHMTVAANMSYGWRRAGRPGGVAAVTAMAGMMGIAHLMGRKPRTLSGGERQRVAIARALLMAPDLLLLDEPLAALDEGRKAEILPYFERLRDETRTPMIYVSHSVEEVTRLADHMVVMDAGEVRATGSVFDVMSRLDLYPLTGSFDAGAILVMRIASHDRQNGLTELAFDGGRFLVPVVEQPAGGLVRVRIQARDIMLAIMPPEGISANNVVAASVAAVREDPPGPYADVQLQCGSAKLVSRVTRLSVGKLGLRPGVAVFAIIKAINIDRRNIAASGPGEPRPEG